MAEVKLLLEWCANDRVILLCGDDHMRDEARVLAEKAGRLWLEYPAAELEAASFALTDVHDGRSYPQHKIAFWYGGALESIQRRSPNIVQRINHLQVSPVTPAAAPAQTPQSPQ